MRRTLVSSEQGERLPIDGTLNNGYSARQLYGPSVRKWGITMIDILKRTNRPNPCVPPRTRRNNSREGLVMS